MHCKKYDNEIITLHNESHSSLQNGKNILYATDERNRAVRTD